MSNGMKRAMARLAHEVDLYLEAFTIIKKDPHRDRFTIQGRDPEPIYIKEAGSDKWVRL